MAVEILEGVQDRLVHIEVLVVGQATNEMNPAFRLAVKPVFFVEVLVPLGRNGIVGIAVVSGSFSDNQGVRRLLV